MSNAVTLRAEHLPTEVRGLFDAYATATETAHDAARAANTAQLADRPALKEVAGEASAAVQAAKDALGAATARANRQLLDHAAGCYLAHVEAARTALAEAEAQMRLAASAASLYATATARPGRPVLDIGSDAAARSMGKVRAMLIVSGVRELVGLMPEDVTG